MLAQYIVAIATFALAAVASPVAVAKRNTTPAQQIQNECGNNFQASCCDSIQKELFGLIPIEIGLNCVSLNGE